MLDTALIRRLRDRLLDRGPPSLGPRASGPAPDLAPYEAAALARVAPLAELLFLMMAADGESDAREADVLRGAIRSLTDGMLRGATADALVERFSATLAREGLDERLGAVTGLLGADRDDAETALMLAAAVATADGSVDAREHALFEVVASHLGISARRRDELLGPR